MLDAPIASSDPQGGTGWDAHLQEEVLAGLAQPQKTLPAKLFYDAEGCRLFGAITQLPEYYPTRTELALLREIGPRLAPRPGCAVVEYGASDEGKAALLWDALQAAAYVPVDVAGGALAALAQRLRAARPSLQVCPLQADFLQPLTLPEAVRGRPAFGFFPGSTIGNLTPPVAIRFLAAARNTLGAGAAMLVGVDIRKPLAVLLPAYNDAQGLTAAFNRNILRHVNRRLGADFDPDSFAHNAVWNEAEGRIEMHLGSRRAQLVQVAGVQVVFAAGETICTEYSYKHTVPGFQALAGAAGWRPEQVWTDPAALFSVHLLAAV